MHEAVLAKAAIPAPTKILGLQMRPYSIGHELWLIRQNNPFSVGGAVSRKQLFEAALICCETWDGASRINRDPIIGLKLWLWTFGQGLADTQIEIANFKQYREQGMLSLPSDSPPTQTPSRPLGAPFLLRMIQFLLTARLSDARSVWDYPLGLAQCHYETWLEKEGSILVLNEDEQGLIDYAAAEDAKEAACRV